MNRLAFGEFHQKHFGAEQKAYWSSILQQQQQSTRQTDQDVQFQSTEPYTYYQHDFDQQYSHYQHDPNQQYTYYQQDPDQQFGLNYHATEPYTEYQYDNHNDNQQYTDEYYQEEYQYEEEEEEYGSFSKEAMEIFKFSEAYRKEREAEKQKELEEDMEGMDNWQYDESNVHCSGGLEAPSTSLVLLKPESERPSKNSKLRIQEELLNSAYLASCRQDSTPVVLWPVLPFKM